MDPIKQEENWYPIEKLPMFESLVVDGIEHTEENYATFQEAKEKPHLLDDSIVDRALQLYTSQLEEVDYYERQIARWRKGSLKVAHQGPVDALEFRVRHLRNITENFIALFKDLRKVTINRIMEMSDEKLAIKVLSGELKLPKPSEKP